MTSPLLQINQVTRGYVLPREHLWQKPPVVQALKGVSLEMHSGRSLGVVGESGSGKSTLARLVIALEQPDSGSVQMLGRDLNQLDPARLREARRDFQMVFQDPYGSLDPRQTVEKIVCEPLTALGNASRPERRQQALDVLTSVGLRPGDLDKYPHEFSGGQRQRIAIARALVTRPKLIVADEPVSALDVSVQAQVLNLMQDLQQQFGVTFLLISHDLAVVDHLCDEVAVLYQGRVVEQGTPEALFHHGAHPYTRALLEAVPSLAPDLSLPRKRHIPIQLSDSLRPPPLTACPYSSRCPQAQPVCQASIPALAPMAPGHLVACHLAGAG